ncbi:MAG: phage integrase N-terminal domain-containing protein [Bacillota bacterium]
MNYKWSKTGIGSVDNLGAQAQKILRGSNRASIETRWRYSETIERFTKHIGKKFNTQKIQNIQDKHLESYVNELKDRGCADKYVKNELAAIRWFHNQIPNAKFELEDSRSFNRKMNFSSTGDGRADRAWTEREVEEMKQKAFGLGQKKIGQAIEGMRSMGLRLDELVTIRREQAEKALRDGKLYLIKTKGGRERSTIGSWVFSTTTHLSRGTFLNFFNL